MSDATPTTRKTLLSDRAGLDVVDTTGTTAQSDLVGAVAELDARWREIAGASLGAVERLAQIDHLNHRDRPALAATLASDFVAVDHSPAGFPAMDGAAWMATFPTLVDIVPDAVFLVTMLYASASAALACVRVWGATEDGSEVEWANHHVVRVGPASRATHGDIFPVEQRAEALARFDAWVVEDGPSPVGRPGPLSNRAVEINAELVPIFEAGDWDRYREHVASDVIGDDRRTTINAGRTVGGERLLELARSLVEVGFTSVTQIPIAVRGEQLALLRRTFHNPDSFDMDVLALVEFDGHGRLCRNTLFDPDDVVGAMAEMDERFAAGEGAPFATFVRESAAFWRLYNAREWDTMLECLRETWVILDHRLASAGTIQSAAEFVDYARAMVELVLDVVAYEDERLALGARCGLSRVVARGTSTDGAEIEIVALNLGEMVDGTLARGEMFAPEQLESARAP